MKEAKKRKIYVALGIVFLAAVAGLYSYLYLIPSITDALTPTVTVEYGQLQTVEVAWCTVVREETVVYAQEAGEVSYYAKETEKTRKGTKVLDVYPPGSTGSAYTASVTGFVSYYLDGYEDFFKPDSMASLNGEILRSTSLTPKRTERQSAEKGDALFKLITSDIWYMVLSVPEEEKPAYRLNSTVTVEFAEGSVKASVSEVYDRAGDVLVILKTNRFFPEFARIRQQDVKIITSDYTGLILPESALAREGEETGAYVQSVDGSYRFVPVEVLTQSGGQVLVSADGGLRIYDTVLRNVDNDQEE